MGWDGDAAGALNWHLRPWDHLALRSSSTEGSPGREGDVATERQRPLPAPPAHTQDGGRAFSISSLPIIPRMRGLRVDVTRVVRACVRSAPRARNGSGIRWRQGRFRRGTRVGAAGGGVSGGTGDRGELKAVLWALRGTLRGFCGDLGYTRGSGGCWGGFWGEWGVLGVSWGHGKALEGTLGSLGTRRGAPGALWGHGGSGFPKEKGGLRGRLLD